MIATIILLVIMCIGLGVSLAKHGQEREETYNFWFTLFLCIIELVLYYYAGLFDKFIN